MTDPNFSLFWAKVGSLVDVGNYAPDAHFEEIVELGPGYIRAVYPLIGPQSSQEGNGSRLDYIVLISPDGNHWSPIGFASAEAHFVLDTGELAAGEYQIEVLALNAIRVGRSNHVTLEVKK